MYAFRQEDSTEILAPRKPRSSLLALLSPFQIRRFPESGAQRALIPLLFPPPIVPSGRVDGGGEGHGGAAMGTDSWP